MVCATCEKRDTCRELCPDMEKLVAKVEGRQRERTITDIENEATDYKPVVEEKRAISEYRAILKGLRKGSAPGIEKKVIALLLVGTPEREIARCLDITKEKVKKIIKVFTG